MIVRINPPFLLSQESRGDKFGQMFCENPRFSQTMPSLIILKLTTGFNLYIIVLFEKGPQVGFLGVPGNIFCQEVGFYIKAVAFLLFSKGGDL